MSKSNFLHVGMATLDEIQAATKTCIFPVTNFRPDKKIRETFRVLREMSTAFGLDPDTLLHIGIPVLDGQELISYTCCIEFPYPVDEVINGILVKTLPGGPYTILRMQKKPAVIARSIRQFTGDYIPDHEIIIDPTRPVYEIYYDDEMEYCVPVLD